eukprot:m.295570 g.295570  ORF g.295570 m.295570 type:complete len:238 (-) comp16265_c0_seq1:117-830(-)
METSSLAAASVLILEKFRMSTPGELLVAGQGSRLPHFTFGSDCCDPQPKSTRMRRYYLLAVLLLSDRLRQVKSDGCGNTITNTAQCEAYCNLYCASLNYAQPTCSPDYSTNSATKYQQCQCNSCNGPNGESYGPCNTVVCENWNYGPLIGGLIVACCLCGCLVGGCYMLAQHTQKNHEPLRNINDPAPQQYAPVSGYPQQVPPAYPAQPANASNAQYAYATGQPTVDAAPAYQPPKQ